MRKIILNLAITLDGYIEGPNGELDWLVRDEKVDFGDILQDILSDKDIIFYGRISYDKWGNYQPDEKATQKIRDAYKLLQRKQKYVFSKTKKDDPTSAIFINANIKERVAEIKAQPGKNIWLYGGANLITTFLNLNLIDEYRLAVHPVILGKGKPLFTNIETQHNLTLIEAKGYPSGVTLMNYKATPH
ncbi:dihydrofolate reductase family protein [Chryseolinea soli]|uniref:Dihydrofolate reductase n=1 Tax=Chryseolinea soli TaxID=2321403 RepID=A0A385SYF4_9BACT|nr:dihydrofolate reductase family protein [Chryseolinea soli]AYB35115.1 dihydrofolate reductase [Chryseolinea soli]